MLSNFHSIVSVQVFLCTKNYKNDKMDTNAATIILWQSTETQNHSSNMSISIKSKLHSTETCLCFKHHPYWKFTGDTVIVLFASNTIVPLIVGSFLLIL